MTPLKEVIAKAIDEPIPNMKGHKTPWIANVAAKAVLRELDPAGYAVVRKCEKSDDFPTNKEACDET